MSVCVCELRVLYALPFSSSCIYWVSLSLSACGQSIWKRLDLSWSSCVVIYRSLSRSQKKGEENKKRKDMKGASVIHPQRRRWQRQWEAEQRPTMTVSLFYRERTVHKSRVRQNAQKPLFGFFFPHSIPLTLSCIYRAASWATRLCPSI